MVRKLKPNEEDLLQRIINKPDLQPFFFRKAVGLHWFDPLIAKELLSHKKNPKPIHAKNEGHFIIPPWPATQYLVNTAKEVLLPENEEYAFKFLEFIRQSTRYAQENDFSNYLTWWQLAQLIRNIPVKLITLEDLELVDFWLNDPYERGMVAEEIGEKWLPMLLKKTDAHSTEIAQVLLKELYIIKFVNKKEPALRFDPWHAKQITDKVASLSGKSLGEDAVKIFESQLTSILQELKNDAWSSIWRPAIEEHEQNHKPEDTEDILIVAYRDCLLGFVDKDIKTAAAYLNNIFDGHYETLKRVAIHIIGERINQLKSLVDSVLSPDYFSSNFRHEVWGFLNQHYHELSQEQKAKTLELIESLKELDEEGKIEEIPTAYIRSIWLKAVKEHDEKATQLYRKYTDVTHAEPDHPSFSSYMSFGWGGESPIPLGDLLSLEVDELINTLHSYKKTGKSDLEELAKAVKAVTKAKADKFYLVLNKFIDLDLPYIHSVIEAYRELWNEKKQLPWDVIWVNLLDFCENVVKKEGFWTEETASQKGGFVANRHWVVSSISELIEAGTKSDDYAFEPKLLPKAKSILVLLLTMQKGEEFNKDSDAVSIAINSPRGRCIETIINQSLRACRLAGKQDSSHEAAWLEYEEIYNAELQRQKEYEFSTLVTMCLPNFLYMSDTWVKSNLPSIFDQTDYVKWLCAMQGYSHSSIVYPEIYQYLKSNGDFIRALDDKNLNKKIDEKIVQNIFIAYLYEYEKFEDPDSLISLLLKRNIYAELNHMIWFAWSLKGRKNIELAPKIYKLWPLLLKIIDFTNEEGQKLASSLCRWAAFVDKVDDTSEKWLLQVAPYAVEDHNSPELLENLARISKDQAIQAQEIWIKMLESPSYDYPEDAIRQILSNLVALGDDGIRQAREVVDAYIRQGIDRPRTWLNEILSTRK